MHQTHKSIKELCRELRKNSTHTENLLWQILRNRKLAGLKFLRQYPIIYGNYGTKQFFYIADFYCAERKLAIELDGKIHDNQKEYDKERDRIISEKGITVLRIKNEELDNVGRVLDKLEKVLDIRF